MIQHKLTETVYRFEKTFNVWQPNELTDHEEKTAKVELHLNFEQGSFWLDLNDLFNEQMGLMKFTGLNQMGNKYENAVVMAKIFIWLAEISTFAREQVMHKFDFKKPEQRQEVAIADDEDKEPVQISQKDIELSDSIIGTLMVRKEDGFMFRVKLVGQHFIYVAKYTGTDFLETGIERIDQVKIEEARPATESEHLAYKILKHNSSHWKAKKELE